MSNHRKIARDQNVTHVDFEGLHTPEPLSRSDKVKRVAAGAAVVAVAATGFHYMDEGPKTPPANTDPSFSRNLEHSRLIMITEQSSGSQPVDVQHAPTDIPVIHLNDSSSPK